MDLTQQKSVGNHKLIINIHSRKDSNTISNNFTLENEKNVTLEFFTEIRFQFLTIFCNFFLILFIYYIIINGLDSGLHTLEYLIIAQYGISAQCRLFSNNK